MTTTREETADEKRLREVREQIEARRTAREQRYMPTLEEQLAVEAKRLEAEEKLDELEAQHGRVGKEIQLIESDNGFVIARRPTMASYRKFQDTKDTDTKDVELLVRPCVLYPSKAEFDRMCEEKPALLGQVAKVCAELAGLRADEAKKK